MHTPPKNDVSLRKISRFDVGLLRYPQISPLFWLGCADGIKSEIWLRFSKEPFFFLCEPERPKKHPIDCREKEAAKGA